MNQAMSRQLRKRHLLLLVPLLLASAPPSLQGQAPALLPGMLSDFRVQVQTPTVAGAWAPFTVTAIDDTGGTVTNYLGTVNVTVSGTESGADVEPPLYVFLGLGQDNGVGNFRARWLTSGAHHITVTDTLGTVNREQPVAVTAAPATRLELILDASTDVGTRITATVVARDGLSNVDTGFTGTIRFNSSEPRAAPAGTYTFSSLDRGVKTFTIAFESAGFQSLTVSDANATPTVTPDTDFIEVRAGLAKFFQITSPVKLAMAGEPVEFTVAATDAYGNPVPFDSAKRVQLTSSDGLARPVGEVAYGAGAFDITFGTAGLQTVTLSYMNGAVFGQLTGFQVLPGPFYEVKVSTPQVQPVDACAPAVVNLRAADFFGNTVPDDVPVLLCGTPGQALTIAGQTLESVQPDRAGCIRGKLPATGQAQVSWSNRDPVPVTFSVSEPTPPQPSAATITWQRGGFSPAHSPLSFPNAPDSPPLLRTFTGELRLRFDVRDACETPVELPSGKTLSFVAQSPLFLGMPALREAVGQWSTSVRLPKCPDSDAAMKIWPALDGEPILLPGGQPRHIEVHASCLPPDVQLAIRAKPEGKVMPGAGVEFRVEVSNTGSQLIPAGVLWLEPEGMTGLEARLDDEPLAAFETKINLAELSPGAKQTVKLLGQAAVQPDPPVKLTSWYTTVDGAALTEKQVVGLEVDELGADVGCGCQTGSLPSQLLPWLALLAAASRSRSRLRRLTRGERNDR
jgi:hypothetical protein